MSLKIENEEKNNVHVDHQNSEGNKDIVSLVTGDKDISIITGDGEKKVKKRYFQQFRVQWLKDPRNKDWLRRIEGNNTKCFCKYCNTKLAAKLSDIEKHRNTRKHKNSQAEYYTLRNLMINGSVSDEDLYNESLRAAFRIDDSFREEDVDENPPYGTESFVSKEEDEIDSFAKSIAAQMKMLREEDTIELTFEIQNLVTQRRRKLMEAKLAEKQVENDLPQKVITVSVDHTQLPNVVTNRH